MQAIKCTINCSLQSDECLTDFDFNILHSHMYISGNAKNMFHIKKLNFGTLCRVHNGKYASGRRHNVQPDICHDFSQKSLTIFLLTTAKIEQMESNNPLHSILTKFPYSKTFTKKMIAINPIGMREGNFYHSSFLDQILSAEFLSNEFQTFFEVKIDINWINSIKKYMINLTAQLIEFYKKKSSRGR